MAISRKQLDEVKEHIKRNLRLLTGVHEDGVKDRHPWIKATCPAHDSFNNLHQASRKSYGRECRLCGAIWSYDEFPKRLDI